MNLKEKNLPKAQTIHYASFGPILVDNNLYI